MSTACNDGGPAFPSRAYLEHDEREIPGQPGMSLRDYFAAKALTSLLLLPAEYRVESEHGTMLLCGREGASQLAYMYADAMLKARQA